MPIKVALVEDVRDTREMLVALLRGTPGFRCVEACETAEQGLRLIPIANPDVVLIDLGLPGKSGVHCIRDLRRVRPGIRILVHTVHEDPENLFGALRAGALGYVLKRTGPADLLKAIHEVHTGGASMTPAIAIQVFQAFHDPPGAPAPNPLTGREKEVLHLAASGMTYRQVADKLGISPATARTHFRNIYEKLHVHSLDGALSRLGTSRLKNQ